MTPTEQRQPTANRPSPKPGVRGYVLLAVGFGCLIGYTRMLSLGFVGYLSNGVIESVDVWYGLRSCACLVMLALLACSGWFRWFKVGTKALIAATVGAIAAAAVFALDEAGAFGWAVALVGGLSSAVLMFAWMLLLSCYEARAIAIASIGGLALSGCIIMGVPNLGVVPALAVAAVAAFVMGSSALLLDPDLESCTPDGPLGYSQAARVPWITVVMLLVSSFLATILYGIAEHLTWLYDWSPNYVAFGVAAVAVLGATFALLLKSDRWTHALWLPQILLVVVALAFSCFSVRLSIQIAVGLFLAAVFCSHFLHWVVFPSLFSALRIPRVFLAGIVLICANGALAVTMGDALGDLLPHSMQNLGGVAGIGVIVLVAAFAITEFAYRSAFGPIGLFSQPAVSPARRAEGLEDAQIAGTESPLTVGADRVQGDNQEDPASVQESDLSDQAAVQEVDPLVILQSRIDNYTVKYGLTPREVEVAFLTAQGFSCGYIAEKLVVSESTVRFHQKNLYRKFDVHSRNEFIEFVRSES